MVQRVQLPVVLMVNVHGASVNPVRGFEEDCGRVRQLRSLVVVFALYACVLLFVILFVTDGGHIGSILAGIAGHAVYVGARTAYAWREATWLDSVRGRMLRRHPA